MPAGPNVVISAGIAAEGQIVLVDEGRGGLSVPMARVGTKGVQTTLARLIAAQGIEAGAGSIYAVCEDAGTRTRHIALRCLAKPEQAACDAAAGRPRLMKALLVFGPRSPLTPAIWGDRARMWTLALARCATDGRNGATEAGAPSRLLAGSSVAGGSCAARPVAVHFASLLSRVQLSGIAHRRPQELSGGLGRNDAVLLLGELSCTPIPVAREFRDAFGYLPLPLRAVTEPGGEAWVPCRP